MLWSRIQVVSQRSRVIHPVFSLFGHIPVKSRMPFNFRGIRNDCMQGLCISKNRQLSSRLQ